MLSHEEGSPARAIQEDPAFSSDNEVSCHRPEDRPPGWNTSTAEVIVLCIPFCPPGWTGRGGW